MRRLCLQQNPRNLIVGLAFLFSFSYWREVEDSLNISALHPQVIPTGPTFFPVARFSGPSGLSELDI
jgi:hypothetical protein